MKHPEGWSDGERRLVSPPVRGCGLKPYGAVDRFLAGLRSPPVRGCGLKPVDRKKTT